MTGMTDLFSTLPVSVTTLVAYVDTDGVPGDAQGGAEHVAADLVADRGVAGKEGPRQGAAADDATSLPLSSITGSRFTGLRYIVGAVSTTFQPGRAVTAGEVITA